MPTAGSLFTGIGGFDLGLERAGFDVAFQCDNALQQASTVRRLTPVECERLQGFPDNWTLVDGKTPDGPRYKACGNAVTVPVIEYLGRRIIAAIS